MLETNPTIKAEPTANVSLLDQLLNLRGQCESAAKVQRLYAKRSKNWISWQDVQLTRLAATKHYQSLPSTNHAAKLKGLVDLLVILFHSITPPDRVGVVRRLKWNHTLLRDAEGYRLDLSKFRHKTCALCIAMP